MTYHRAPDTGVRSALTMVMEEYMQADPETREDSVLGGLAAVLIAEALDERCTFVGKLHDGRDALPLNGHFCGRSGVVEIGDRHLCERHAVYVAECQALRKGRMLGSI